MAITREFAENTSPKRERGKEPSSLGLRAGYAGNHARLIKCVAVVLLAILPVACQQDMAAQPSYKPLDPSDFFVDGRSARPLVPGTVARGHLRLDTQLYTGKRTRESRDYAGSAAMIAASAQGPLGVAATIQLENRDYVDTFPFPVTRDVLEQGLNRYMIYCVVCHDPLGTGHGKIVERGYTQPPSYHIPRLREAPVGRFFDVMTNGYGSMPSYREEIPPRDRWAIVAYIRALQLSQHFPEKELTPEMREERERQERSQAAEGRPE
jgi:mono/diheme cytochrome c family protein